MPTRPVSNRRSGLTLIELLVVLVIVVVLLALLLPSVSRSRTASRRSQCKNNLKQIGLALANYHDSFTTFPPGFVLGETGVYHGWGWGILIMPYLDDSPYFNQVAFGVGLQREYLKKSLNPVKGVYRCPSDPGSDYVEHTQVATSDVSNWRVTTGTVDAANTFSRSNYFGVAGYLQADVGGIKFDVGGEPSKANSHFNAGSLGNRGSSFSAEHGYCDPQNFQGLFGQNSRITIKDILDGTSNVIVVGERYTPRDSDRKAVGHGTWIGVPDCSTAAGLAMALGDTSVKLNSGLKRHGQTTEFGSEHAGGANFLLGDGSVRFLAENIELAIYRNLSTIADGMPLGEF